MTLVRPHGRILVLGGARSGKSSFAERAAAEIGEDVLYVATARALDREMHDRIERHRAQRSPDWTTLEAPRDVARAVLAAHHPGQTIVLEDLTLWLSNLLLDETVGSDEEVDSGLAAAAEREVLEDLSAIFQLAGTVVAVTNEIGLGLVPAYPLGRVFRDSLGRVNQAAAALADEVFFLLAGVPVRIKPSPALWSESGSGAAET